METIGQKTFSYMGHEFKNLGSLKENGFILQDVLRDSYLYNSLNLRYDNGYNFEKFYLACGDDKACVFECEGKIYFPMRSGLHELRTKF